MAAIQGRWSAPEAPRDTAGPVAFQKPQNVDVSNAGAREIWPSKASNSFVDKGIPVHAQNEADAPDFTLNSYVDKEFKPTPFVDETPDECAPEGDERTARRERAKAHVERCLTLMSETKRAGYVAGMSGFSVREQVDYLQRSVPIEWERATKT